MKQYTLAEYEDKRARQREQQREYYQRCKQKKLAHAEVLAKKWMKELKEKNDNANVR